MKISTKGRYAVRVMLDLACCDPKECVKVKDIANRQGISEKYLEQIISTLTKGGCLHSVRGAQGGYKMNGEPKDYTVGMILRLTEGSMAPVACVEAGGLPCERKMECDTYGLWEDIYKAVNSVIDNVTIEDLKNRRESRLHNLDFNI